MSIGIMNSLTHRKELFTTLEPGVVKMYVCGPTVYDEPHLGHLRSAYVFELIRNYFEAQKFRVIYVRNVTDVDDKIINRAHLGGTVDLQAEVKKVSETYYELYQKALAEMGLRVPTVEPRATAHIAEMIELVAALVTKGFAYESAGDVYFSVEQFENYGRLSGQKKEAMLEGTRVLPTENKKASLDFALWKKAKPGEPSWPSPWGQGRPGWHIECSAMSMKYLGPSFDLHGGGRDLIFPHHENEIAQSETHTGKPFARFWVHHGLVTRDGQKMSKSLKNFLTLHDLTRDNPHGVEELKFLFLSTHYAMPLDVTRERLAMQKAVREKFTLFLEDASRPASLEAKSRAASKISAELDHFHQKFFEAMDDDFNTPQTLTVLHDLVHWARVSGQHEAMTGAAAMLREFSRIFSLRWPMDSPGNEAEIERAISERLDAKNRKDFQRADAIRKGLLQKGITLSDRPDGSTTWHRA